MRYDSDLSEYSIKFTLRSVFVLLAEAFYHCRYVLTIYGTGRGTVQKGAEFALTLGEYKPHPYPTLICILLNWTGHRNLKANVARQMGGRYDYCLKCEPSSKELQQLDSGELPEAGISQAMASQITCGISRIWDRSYR